MSRVVDYLRTEPVVVAGVILTILTAVYEAGVADGFTPATIVPVLVSFLTRLFTVPASEVIDLDELVANDADGGIFGEDGSTGPIV